MASLVLRSARQLTVLRIKHTETNSVSSLVLKFTDGCGPLSFLPYAQVNADQKSLQKSEPRFLPISSISCCRSLVSWGLCCVPRSPPSQAPFRAVDSRGSAWGQQTVEQMMDAFSSRFPTGPANVQSRWTLAQLAPKHLSFLHSSPGSELQTWGLSQARCPFTFSSSHLLTCA